MSTVSHFLIPTGEGNQYLNTISLPFNEEVILGRNEKTFVTNDVKYSQFISRQLVSLKLTKEGVVLKLLVGESSGGSTHPSLNGSVLEPGKEYNVKTQDVICLFPKNSYFNYTLVSNGVDPANLEPIDITKEDPIELIDLVDDDGEEKVKVNVPAVTFINLTSPDTCSPGEKNSGKHKRENDDVPNSKTQKCVENKDDQAKIDIIPSIANFSDCAICLLPMAFTHSINPCGHNFCFQCINEWSNKTKKCPSCQGPIASVVPSHFADNIINEILKNDKGAHDDWKSRELAGKELKKSIQALVKSKKSQPPNVNINPMQFQTGGNYHNPQNNHRGANPILHAQGGAHRQAAAPTMSEEHFFVRFGSRTTDGLKRCLCCKLSIQNNELICVGRTNPAIVLHATCVGQYNRVYNGRVTFSDGVWNSPIGFQQLTFDGNISRAQKRTLFHDTGNNNILY